jgi:hypothetical protein
MQSKVWVCGCLLTGIAGLNPARGMDVVSLVIVMCCQVEVLYFKNSALEWIAATVQQVHWSG